MKILFKSCIYGLIAVFLVSFLTSCKNIAEKAAEKIVEESIEHASGEEVDIDYENEKVVIETEEGKMEINASSKSWPDEIPSEVPKFDYGKITSVMINEADEIKGWTVICEDVPADAVNEYNDLLKKKGFKTQLVSMPGTGGNISAEKDDIVIGLLAAEGGASVSVQIKQ